MIPKKKLRLSASAVLDTDFFYGWQRNRDNPQYKKLIPPQTVAFQLLADREGLSDEQVALDFRAVAPELVKGFLLPRHALLFWIWAVLDERGMTRVLLHLDQASPKARFRVFETQPDRGGRFGAWVSVVWGPSWFAEFMKDGQIVFDTGISLYAVVVEYEKVERFLNMEGPVAARDFASLIEDVRCAMVFHHHLEGVYILSSKMSSAAITAAVRKSLPARVSLVRE